MTFSGVLDALETWSLATIGMDPIPNGSLPYGLSFADNLGGVVGLGIVKGSRVIGDYASKIGKFELHHVFPKYLGGAKNGKLVPLDASYHQLITNEFRSLHPYGMPKPPLDRATEIMNQVYQKYPLP